jgi:hypothetical protein
MEPIDPQEVENSLEDCARHQDQFMRTARSFHLKADNKSTRSVECVVFMTTGVRISSIDELTTDEYGLQSMTDIDPADLRMSSRQWEKQGLMLSGKALDHLSMYRADLSDEENAENMYWVLVNLPAEVITYLIHFFLEICHFFLEILRTFTGIFLRVLWSEYSFSDEGTFLSLKRSYFFLKKSEFRSRRTAGRPRNRA